MPVFCPFRLRPAMDGHWADHAPPPEVDRHLREIQLADANAWAEWTRDWPVPPKGFRGCNEDREGRPLPGRCGPEAMASFREIVGVVRPERVLEIGLGWGDSAILWLHLSQARVVSVDVSDRDETAVAASVLKQRFFDRFDFVLQDSRDVYDLIRNASFDTIFIDGEMSVGAVLNDLRLAQRLGVRRVLLNNWWPCFTSGVRVAVSGFPDFQMTHLFGNIAYGTLP